MVIVLYLDYVYLMSHVNVNHLKAAQKNYRPKTSYGRCADSNWLLP